MNAKQTEGSYGDTYNDVFALYLTLNDIGDFTLRRAEMKGGECRAEPMDFMADVFLKSKRALSGDVYALGELEMVLRSPDKYPMVSPVTKATLGRTFERYGLGVDGPYKILYIRAKNAR